MNEAAPDELSFVRKLVRDQSGMVLSEDKDYFINSKLRWLARQEHFVSLTELVKQLRDPSNAGLRRAMIEQILVNETCFFRDGHPFEALRSAILPELVRQCDADRELNIWCAATSTGQEPYSVAILLHEAFPELARWSLRLLATDLSDANLERARAGFYTDGEVARGLSEQLRRKYFYRDGDGWRLHDSLRKRIQFVRMNLIGDWSSLPPMDLVLLRNVLIYFDPVTRATILDKLCHTIRDGGYLLLGATESLVDEATGFAPLRAGSTIFYRRKSSSVPQRLVGS